jgi:hypothetical protein
VVKRFKVMNNGKDAVTQVQTRNSRQKEQMGRRVDLFAHEL